MIAETSNVSESLKTIEHMLYDYHNFTEINLQNERRPPIIDE